MDIQNIVRVFDFVFYQQAHFPQERALGYLRDSDGRELWWSTQAIIRDAELLAAGLLDLGLKMGDRVAIVDYVNRPEWVITDLACQMAGLVSVPLYPTISSREYNYILKDSGARAVFMGGQDLHAKISAAVSDIPAVQWLFSFEPDAPAPNWTSVQASSADGLHPIRNAISPDALFTIIYTSGTTGFPKGVMIKHSNLVFNIKTILPLIPIRPGMRCISFLPLCHVFERAVSMAYFYAGVSVWFTTPDKLGGDQGDIKRIQPHFFTTVPRLLEKVYEKIYNKGLELKGAKRALFFWALSLAEDYEYDKTYSGLAAVKKTIADKLIFSKWRAALGGHLQGIVTGAAPCPVKMARVFSFAGIPIREGYGLTESAPAISISHFAPGNALLGTVGLVLEGTEVFIDSDDPNYGPGEGEILASGPHIMMGYYNKPEENARVFRDMNGKQWLCTGDVGKWVTGPGGKQFLQITDRKKELLKTSGGKYVAPAPIESKLKESFLIDQAMVIGDNYKFVSALIIPAWDGLIDWCKYKQIDISDRRKLLQNERVIDKFQRIVNEVNEGFGKVEQVKAFRLLPDPWEPVKADGTESELTPTMKLKRRVIMEKHQDAIQSIYPES